MRSSVTRRRSTSCPAMPRCWRPPPAAPPHALLLASPPACPVQAFRVGSNVYATQFHPELDVPGIVTRIDVYKYAGYFAPEEAETIKDLARASTVCHPPAIVRRFVERYAAS